MSKEAVLQKQHLNANGEWTKCEATQRACRYGSPTAHREVEVEEPVNANEEEYLPRKWQIAPEFLPEIQKKLEAINRRINKASKGESELFEFTTELITKNDKITGLEYQVMELTLNKPRIIQNGYEFVARVDEIKNPETGDVSFIVASLADQDVTSSIELKPNYCDHCGKVRHRNNTYVIKTPTGEYRQIGSACMRAYLGVAPTFWAFDPEYIEDKLKSNSDPLNFEGGFGRRSPISPRAIIELALALTDGGKYYGGAQSIMPTKIKLSQYLYDPKLRKEMQNNGSVFEGDWKTKADEILSELKFEGNSDYERNMKTLLSNDFVDPRFLGYVASAIPAYAKQTGIAKIQKPAKPARAIGYVGQPNEVIENIPVKVVGKFHTTVPGRYYNQPDQHLTIVTMRTADNKQIKWLSSSNAAADIEEDSDIIIKRARVKSHSINDYSEAKDEETLVKLVKLEPKKDD